MILLTGVPGTEVVAGDVLDRASLFIMTAAHAAEDAKSEGADLDIPTGGR